eukprot:1156463-Pelagomonas_calceolata.AAC.2
MDARHTSSSYSNRGSRADVRGSKPYRPHTRAQATDATNVPYSNRVFCTAQRRALSAAGQQH